MKALFINEPGLTGCNYKSTTPKSKQPGSACRDGSTVTTVSAWLILKGNFSL